MTRTERGAHVAEWAALLGARTPDGSDDADGEGGRGC